MIEADLEAIFYRNMARRDAYDKLLTAAKEVIKLDPNIYGLEKYTAKAYNDLRIAIARVEALP